MSNAVSALRNEADRPEGAMSTVRGIFAGVLGVKPQELDADTHFVEMGIDSLALLQVSQKIQGSFAVKLPFRRMFEELSTLRLLSQHLENEVVLTERHGTIAGKPAPVEPASEDRVRHTVSQSASFPDPSSVALPQVAADKESFLDSVVAMQLKIMAQQLELLRERTSSQRGHADLQIASNAGTMPADNDDPGIQSKPVIAFEPIRRDWKKLTPQQQDHVQALTGRLISRMTGSRKISEKYRPVLADNRATAGFRLLWKDLQFPLMAARAEGSHLWDIDGNEYIDIAMGFGALLFGHSPAFLIQALEKQISLGLQLGAESVLAGETAALLKELTGVERATFCNSGTEAVMSALRLARTITGRTRIAMFEGCYHGSFDGVLIQPDQSADGTTRPIPLAPGVPQHMIDNVLLLKLNDPASLEAIKSCRNDLAAVLLEPLPSRLPDLKPEAFLRELRKITSEAGIALIFDEVVTGFRFHQGGAQAIFGVQADLVTYGKAAGGGMPVAILGGKARYMDAIDGGMWNYGDNSFPTSETTYFAGTYFKHPLIMAPLHAVLTYIKDTGPKLQEDLSRRSTELAEKLNGYFEQSQVPMRVSQFGSLFRFLFHPDVKYPELFYFHLLEAGIYICETRNCFLSTAHSDQDLVRIEQAVKQSVERLREGGFLPGRSHTTTVVDIAAVKFIALTEAQKDLWALAQMGDEASRACNESLVVRLRGSLDLEVLRHAINEIGRRHESTRVTLLPDGEGQAIHPERALDLGITDLTALPEDKREAAFAHWREKEANQVFDLIKGPLMRFQVVKLTEQDHGLIFTAHHVVTDGVSNGLLMYELATIYSGMRGGRAVALREPMRFSEYVEFEIDGENGIQKQEHERYWLEQLSGVSLSLRSTSGQAASTSTDAQWRTCPDWAR